MVQTNISIAASPYTVATQYGVLPQPFYTVSTEGLGTLLPAPLFNTLLPNMFAASSLVST